METYGKREVMYDLILAINSRCVCASLHIFLVSGDVVASHNRITVSLCTLYLEL